MKIPRDISGKTIIKKLEKLGYIQTRQSGSHIRLTVIIRGKEHHITIPNHNPIKIGTLNNILKDISSHKNTSKDENIKNLFYYCVKFRVGTEYFTVLQKSCRNHSSTTNSQPFGTSGLTSKTSSLSK